MRENVITKIGKDTAYKPELEAVLTQRLQSTQNQKENEAERHPLTLEGSASLLEGEPIPYPEPIPQTVPDVPQPFPTPEPIPQPLPEPPREPEPPEEPEPPSEPEIPPQPAPDIAQPLPEPAPTPPDEPISTS